MTTGRSAGDQVNRPASRVATPDQDRTIADLRKRVLQLEEKVRVLSGERGDAGRTEAAVRKSDLASLAVSPIKDPEATVTAGPAGGAYGATEQTMLDELKAAVEELQVNVAAVLEVQRTYGFVKRGL